MSSVKSATPTLPRPRRKAAGHYHHGDLRTALLRATAEIVRRDGPRAVTMRAVATRAGVSEAAPYHHFRDKNGLLAAAAADGFRALDAVLRGAAAGAGDPRAALISVAEAWIRFAISDVGSYRLILGAHVEELELASNPDTREAGQAARLHVIGLVAAFLERAAEGTDPAGLFRLLWAQVHGTASLFVEKELGRGFTTDDAVAMARDGVTRLLASFG